MALETESEAKFHKASGYFVMDKLPVDGLQNSSDHLQVFRMSAFSKLHLV